MKHAKVDAQPGADAAAFGPKSAPAAIRWRRGREQQRLFSGSRVICQYKVADLIA